MEQFYRDVWIITSAPDRANLVKSIMPNGLHRFMVFETCDAAMAGLESIGFRREKKPDVIISDEVHIYKHKYTGNTLIEKISDRVLEDSASRDVPAIILPQNADLTSESFAIEFKENVAVAFAKNKFFGLIAKTNEKTIIK